MKKQTLFLIAGGMLAFASCNNEGAGGYTDAQVDSMVNARVELIQAELEAQNDSLINARAYEIADSIIAASKGGTKTTSRSTKPSTPAKTTPAAPEKPAVDPQKSRNNQNTSAEDQKSRNNQNTSVEDQKRRNNQN